MVEQIYLFPPLLTDFLLCSFADVELMIGETKSRIANCNSAVSKSKKEQLTETLRW